MDYKLIVNFLVDFHGLFPIICLKVAFRFHANCDEYNFYVTVISLCSYVGHVTRKYGFGDFQPSKIQPAFSVAVANYNLVTLKRI